jgi:hypothetical protein
MDSTKRDRFAVVRIRDIDPEVFLVLLGKPRHSTGFLWTSSLELTEPELRDELARLGKSIDETDALIKKARDNPV